MIKALLGAGGPGLLIPLALAAAVMYLVNWLLGLENRRSERRRQFLELWPKRVADDDLWTEVALRHLTGEYLPRKIVDVALSQQDKAIAMIELANVWDYLELTESSPPQLQWKRQRYRSTGGRRKVRWIFNLGYFVTAWGAGWLLLAVVRSPLNSMGWLWGIVGGVTALIALMLLAHDHNLKEAGELAPRWITRVNLVLGRCDVLAAASEEDANPAQSSASVPGALP